MRSRLTPLFITLATLLALTVSLVAPAAANESERDEDSAAGFAVYHGSVDVPLVTAGSDGHQLGDVRVTSAVLTDADGAEIGRLDASLTTTAIDQPATGDEDRIGVLVFSFGKDAADQITVHGTAHYPADGATIATGDTTVRPIVGGSGKFAGVGGDAVTTHLDDDTWVHQFRMRDARMARDEAKAERKEARDEAKAERKEARDEAKAERKGDDDALPVDALYAQVPSDGSGVVRTDLGIAEPGIAPGTELGLWHYIIPAGQELAPHTHPGTQLARVVTGELEYTVVSGEGILLRADGTSEPMGPGTYILDTGDGVIENPELVHFGANRTDDPMTLLAATLYEAGADLSTLVELPAE